MPKEVGIGFMFAPAFHPAMKYCRSAPARDRHSHRLQHPRSADQPGPRPGPGSGRGGILTDGEDGRGAAHAGMPPRAGGSWRGWLGRNHHYRQDASLESQRHHIKMYSVTPEDFGFFGAAWTALGAYPPQQRRIGATDSGGDRRAATRRGADECRRCHRRRRQGEESPGSQTRRGGHRQWSRPPEAGATGQVSQSLGVSETYPGYGGQGHDKGTGRIAGQALRAV